MMIPSTATTTTTRIYGTQVTEEEDNNGGPLSSLSSDKLLGILVLLTVPIAWGTYTPVVKYLYAVKPAVPGFVFSACYYALAAATMSTLVAINSSGDSSSDGEEARTTIENGKIKSNGGSIPIQGGLELGSYLFIANCLQVIGLQTVPSDRAGFLVQFTTVMVPFVEALFAGNLLQVPIRTWLACVFAFLGLFVMGLDGRAELASDPVSALLAAVSSFSQGDYLILGAAVLYTLHVVRLGSYARETTPLRLAATKASVETVFSLLLLSFLGSLAPLAGQSTGLLGFAADSGKEIISFYSSFGEGISSGSIPMSALFPAIGAVLWTGWVTCAYTIYAQSFGQAKVSPTNANLIYTFQPIFTALIAFLLLGETMGPAGVVGGSIIAGSVFVVATASFSEESTSDSIVEIQSLESDRSILDVDGVTVEDTEEEEPMSEVVNRR
ncbi:unnamed protein product [Cylindrotheca closterium]|uniref:EamA domain-containing protein n=1 Tax=Cylindrotheca closterium TaxID=2856 RepID=A0AAD2FFK4_9STRA|nr:unnamed protein product [Cylindrotheca closterium]